MTRHRLFTMPCSRVYPHYLRAAEANGCTRQEVDTVICRLTGNAPDALAERVEHRKDFEPFVNEAPAVHAMARPFTGTIYGVRIGQIEDPLMRNIRYLDKLVDELAKGRPMIGILRR